MADHPESAVKKTFYSDLLIVGHRVLLELFVEVAFDHLRLLASNLGAIQTS